MTRTRFLIPLLVAMLSGCTAIVGGRQQDPECLEDTDCPTTNVCEGPRVCDGMTHTCVSANTPLDCNDNEPCTTDSCDPAVTNGCVHTLADVDMDGYAPGTCVSASYDGGDCDDANTAINPGATEDCNTVDVDDNCNGDTTDYPATLTCYADADGDGFHDPNVSMAAGCGCPAGYIQPNALGPDCADGVAAANPSNYTYFDKPYCRSGNSTIPAQDNAVAPYWSCPPSHPTPVWDYDCSGTNDQQITSVGTTCYIYSFSVVTSLSTTIINPTLITGAVGGATDNKALTFCSARWDSNYVSSAPACGASARQWTCATSSTCNMSSYTRTQSCR